MCVYYHDTTYDPLMLVARPTAHAQLASLGLWTMPPLTGLLSSHLRGRVFNVSSTLQGKCAISCCVIYVLKMRINTVSWPGRYGLQSHVRVLPPIHYIRPTDACSATHSPYTAGLCLGFWTMPLLTGLLSSQLRERVFNVSSTLQGECAISCIIYVLKTRINAATWPGQVRTPELNPPSVCITDASHLLNLGSNLYVLVRNILAILSSYRVLYTVLEECRMGTMYDWSGGDQIYQ